MREDLAQSIRRSVITVETAPLAQAESDLKELDGAAALKALKDAVDLLTGLATAAENAQGAMTISEPRIKRGGLLLADLLSGSVNSHAIAAREAAEALIDPSTGAGVPLQAGRTEVIVRSLGPILALAIGAKDGMEDVLSTITLAQEVAPHLVEQQETLVREATTYVTDIL